MTDDKSQTKFNRLKKQLEKQSELMFKTVATAQESAECTTRASYRVADLIRLIAKKIKPFTDAEFFKDCLMAVVDKVCPTRKTDFEAVCSQITDSHLDDKLATSTVDANISRLVRGWQHQPSPQLFFSACFFF